MSTGFTDLESYLTQYGKVLGDSAMRSMTPLHTPGEDELLDMSTFLRKPFDPQAHVITSAVKALDRKVGGLFIVGEMGCIAGETLVYDPVARIHRRVDEIDGPFHVVSYHKGKAVIGRAHKPFIKGRRKLYKVTLSNGESFISTDHHRVLTDRGYQLLRDVAGRLRESGPVPLPSIGALCPSVSPRDGDHSTRTPQDSRAGCPMYPHSHDGQPRSAEGSGQEPARPQADAPGHTHESPHVGVSASGSGHSHACPGSDHLSMPRSENLAGCTSHEVASEPQPSSVPCGPGGSPDRDACRSPEGSPPPDTTGSSLRSASQSGCEVPSPILGEFVNDMVHVTDVTYTRTDDYYDFTVDEYHNYVASTIVHHNTGKTLLGMCSAHAHARGKPYVGVVLCPDHLIDKWERELRQTIPGVDVRTFDNWRSVLKLLNLRYDIKRKVPGDGRTNNRSVDVNQDYHLVERDPQTGDARYEHYTTTEVIPKRNEGVEQIRAKWRRPLGPTWLVVGRNQAKWNPDWRPIGDDEKVSLCVGRRVLVGREVKRDQHGTPIIGPEGTPIYGPKTQFVACCPKCGTPLKNKDGDLIAPEEITEKQATCQAMYLRQVSKEDPRLRKPGEEAAPNGGNKTQGLYRIDWNTRNKAGHRVLEDYMESAKGGKMVTVGGTRYEWVECGERLWQWTRKPYRWPPSKIVQKQLRKLIDYCIIDEVHEQKSDESAQSMAAGKLIASAKHVLALTGTLIGGYAHHLFPLLTRMCPDGIVKHEGFKWGETVGFAKKYGRIDTITTTKIGGDADDDAPIVKRGQSGMGRARGGNGKATKRIRIAPGVMPHLFGNHLIRHSVFLQLDDMDESLPRLIDYEITDKLDPEFPGAGPQQLEMDEDLYREYNFVEKVLDQANKELLKKGSMKLLGATLHTLLDYPDRPYDWPPKYKADPENGWPNDSWAVGYHSEKNKVRSKWVDVVQPRSLPEADLRAKEAKLIDICLSAKRRGYQSWVFCQMTGKRDIQPRLKSLLEARGLKVHILRSTTVPLRDRESWIYKNGKGVDVILSHPKLVETGLDLFDKDGNHNFNNLIFYETGYNLFTLRQAARRAWRIGQERECHVHYLFYAGTMQARAMALMGKKLQAAESIDGKFSTEGLIAMAGEENAQLALARSLSEKIEDQKRAWNRFGEKTRKAVVKAVATMRDVLAHRGAVDAILGEGKTAEAFVESVQDSLAGVVSPDEPSVIAGVVGSDVLPADVALDLDDLDLGDLLEGEDLNLDGLDLDSLADIDLDALMEGSGTEEDTDSLLATLAGAGIDLSKLL